MDDLFIFIPGLIVTFMVSGAIALLMWGAANEPAPGEQREPKSDRNRVLKPSDPPVSGS